MIVPDLPATLHGYALLDAGSLPQPVDRPFAPLEAGTVRVRVAGCGLCHTDLGFAFGGVRTRHALPLILGHEISGFVEEAGAGAEALVGRAVVVPAVIPCGACADCRDGFSMICKRQIMPGNDADGGFATHVVVPGHALCVVPSAGEDPDVVLGPGGVTLRHLAVIADAVSTPFQAIKRAEVTSGDLVVVVGLGGVGSYAAQIAALLGAAVVGLDVDPARRAAGESNGCGLTLDPCALPPKELRAAVSVYAKAMGARANRWKILECSGAVAGQETAFGLLVHGATLMIVGFTPQSPTLRLSNLMAFDARAIGNWGCAPELYPEIVDLALSGRLDLVGGVDLRPLSALPATFAEARHGHSGRRVVFAPTR
ncbi:MAG: 6-hydroxycyclohex-1-ene-1-carbonyl-CoA dehydrogenase [Pseudomonadota bacterium]|nr:6-hydroxycyclohex-1-ene-1-carbonyl-CoA dehydrogenase [Pseudomonadota bacterium]